MIDTQTHLIYLLLDSNLPTGGFVASSGLESWAKHGFLNSNLGGYEPVDIKQERSRQSGQGIIARRMTEFVDAELENFVSATAVFVKDAWRIGEAFVKGDTCRQCGKRRLPTAKTRTIKTVEFPGSPDGEWQYGLDETLENVLKLDRYHEAALLSHVSRRASKAQGVAILTLYTKGLSRPPGFSDEFSIQDEAISGFEESVQSREREERAAELVEGYKRLIRKGSSPGHLAVCWGIMTAALGLGLEKAYHLYLFLHARSVLSAAVRLNIIGPYLSSQLLLHPVKGMTERYSMPADEDNGCICNMTQGVISSGLDLGDSSVEMVREDGFWDWTDAAERGPATTWPLGEVLVARHDLQHSRIFNS